MELKIDKSSWVSVTLGEVAFEVSDRIDAPAESDYDRFVGLEHFVSGEVKIQQWESTRSLVSAAKAFQKGDVLFARRNAYLRRASMVDFDGCCSGDAYVLRENHDVIEAGLLPFIVNSNSLWDFANSNAAGTMSKRVKWKDLANYRFLLPPKDQQAEIAELFWAMDSLVDRQQALAESLQAVLDSQTHFGLYGFAFKGMTLSQITDRLNGKGNLCKMPDLGTFLKGKGIPKSQVVSKGLPCIRYGELYTKHHQIVRGISSYIAAENAKNAFSIEYGDVLIAGSGETIEEIGKSAVYLGREQAFCGSDILVFRPFVKGGYWGYMLNSRLVREQLNQRGTGAQVAHIYISDLEKIRVPHHNEDACDTIASTLESTSQAILSIKELIECSRSTLKGLVNDIFSSGHV